MGRTTRETWKARVAQWQASGRSCDAYAKEIGVSAKSLAWWKWSLKSDATGALRRKSARVRSVPVGATRMTRATVPSPLTFVEMSAATVAQPLELVLPCRVVVRVPVGFDPRALERVLEVLERRS